MLLNEAECGYRVGQKFFGSPLHGNRPTEIRVSPNIGQMESKEDVGKQRK